MKLTEAQLDALLKALHDANGGPDGGGLTAVKNAIDALKAKGLLDEKSVDLKALQETVESHSSQMKAMQEALKASRRGFYISGLEDVAPSFSMLKSCIAATGGMLKSHWEKCGAGFEFEVMHQIQMKHQAEFGLMGGAHARIAQQVSAQSLGGAFWPDQVLADIIVGLYHESAWVNLGTEGQTNITVLDGLIGANVTIPKFKEGFVAYWADEAQTVSEGNATTDMMSMQPRELIGIGRITHAQRQFAIPAFEALFRRDMQEAIGEKIDIAVPYGAGGKQPVGVFKRDGTRIFSAQSGKSGVKGTDALGGAKFQADWTGGNLDYEKLDRMGIILQEDKVRASRLKTISSPRYFHTLRHQKIAFYSGQTTEKSYLVPPILTDAGLAALIGPFASTGHMPGGATNAAAVKPGANVGAPSASGTAICTDVARGDLLQVVLGRWNGFTMDDDGSKGPEFKAGNTLFRMIGYFDVGVRQERALMVCPDAIVNV